jgi:hypothetical protein
MHAAQTVELYMGLHRAQNAVPLAELYLGRLASGEASLREVRSLFRDLGALLEYLPNYRDRREELALVT